MHHLFHISKSWHDPAPDVRRGAVLLLAVVLAEMAAWVIWRRTSVDPLVLLGTLRASEAAFLLVYGPWRLSGPAVRSAALRSLTIALVVAGAGLAALALLVRIPLLPDMGLSQGIPSNVNRFTFLFTAAVASPIAEELVFRGLIYRSLRERLSAMPATGLLSAGFGGLHLLFTGRFIVPFAGSLVFCAGYEKEKTIFMPIFLHIFGNFILFMSL